MRMQITSTSADSNRLREVIDNNAPPLEPFSTQKFKTLAKEFFSIKAEKSITCTAKANSSTKTISVDGKINRGVSVGKIIGFIEGVPFLGTPVAAVSFLGHLLGMAIDKHKENSCRNAFNGMPVTGNDLDEVIDQTEVIEKLFNAKLSYAQNARQMRASALSIIPFVKPLTRCVELGIAYFKTPSAALYDLDKDE